MNNNFHPQPAEPDRHNKPKQKVYNYLEELLDEFNEAFEGLMTELKQLHKPLNSN